ncbi:MAG: amidohydrolase family protein [Oscillospiraceae bacterium]|nr:amidohydrolase family protein [Oscillospiraceae bacterium]
MSKKIFDFHTHIFPDKIAERASSGIGGFYDMTTANPGTVNDLKTQMSENGICGCVVCSVATVSEQVSNINNFIVGTVADSDGLFTGFCSLHPGMSESALDEEIKRAILTGLSGIKLHPDIQEFEADGVLACKVYEAVDGRLPVLIHAGDNRYDFSAPKRIANALKFFPNLTMIAAHFGGWSEWDDAVLTLAGKDNLYVDSSSTLYAVTPEKAREYITAFGAERVLFGTDYPMWDIREELERFNRLDLTDSVREKILYGNAKKLLGLNR